MSRMQFLARLFAMMCVLMNFAHRLAALCCLQLLSQCTRIVLTAFAFVHFLVVCFTRCRQNADVQCLGQRGLLAYVITASHLLIRD
jgi:hypothetical protein